MHIKQAKWNSGPPTDTLPYNTLQYLTIPTLPYSCNKYCDRITHSEAQGCGKRSEIVDLQLTNQIPDLLYPTIPTLPYSCNKYCDLIGHSEAQGCGKRSEIVDLQLTNQIPDLLYPTIPYNTLQYLQYLHYHKVIKCVSMPSCNDTDYIRKMTVWKIFFVVYLYIILYIV